MDRGGLVTLRLIDQASNGSVQHIDCFTRVQGALQKRHVRFLPPMRIPVPRKFPKARRAASAVRGPRGKYRIFILLKHSARDVLHYRYCAANRINRPPRGPKKLYIWEQNTVRR